MKRLIPLACLLVVVALFVSVDTARAQETSEQNHDDGNDSLEE